MHLADIHESNGVSCAPLQGIPYSCTGRDLLALYRCLSCRFKFTTDVTKPSEMVGSCFTLMLTS